VRAGSAACSAVSCASRFVTALNKTFFWSAAAAAGADADGGVGVGGSGGDGLVSLRVPSSSLCEFESSGATTLLGFFWVFHCGAAICACPRRDPS